MKTSPPFQRISADISLVILATGFSLMGLTSIIHRPLSGDAMGVSSTGCVMGGCASMATGGIFTVAALLHRRRPSCLAVVRHWHHDASDWSSKTVVAPVISQPGLSLVSVTKTRERQTITNA